MSTVKDRPRPSSDQDGDRPIVLAQRVSGEPGAFLLTVAEAAARLSIGRTLMYELISTGAVGSVTIGRLRRVRLADLETYVSGLPLAPVVPLTPRLAVAA